MNTIPDHDVVAVTSCPYCSAPAGEWCRTKLSGKKTNFIHQDRAHVGRAQIRKEALEQRQADPRVDTRLTSHDMQLRALLKSQQMMAETISVMSEHIKELWDRLGELQDDIDLTGTTLSTVLRRQAVQLVLAGLDGEEPTHEDVWELHEQVFGEPLRYESEDEPTHKPCAVETLIGSCSAHPHPEEATS